MTLVHSKGEYSLDWTLKYAVAWIPLYRKRNTNFVVWSATLQSIDAFDHEGFVGYSSFRLYVAHAMDIVRPISKFLEIMLL